MSVVFPRFMRGQVSAAAAASEKATRALEPDPIVPTETPAADDKKALPDDVLDELVAKALCYAELEGLGDRKARKRVLEFLIERFDLENE